MRKLSLLLAVLVCAMCVGLYGCSNVTQIRVSGSSSVSPIMQKLAAEYERQNKDVRIVITTSDSGTGIKDTLEGKNDIGMASRMLKSSETGVVETKICDDGVVLIVNNSCTLSDVTSDEVYNLFAQGTAIETVSSAISREEGSGTRDAFDSLIKNSEGAALSALAQFSSVVSIQNSTGAVKTEIQTVNSKLGYISLGSVDTSIKALSFDGVAPSVGNIQNGSYKLSRPFNILTKDGTNSSEANAFISFILSAEGQQIIEDNGFVKL